MTEASGLPALTSAQAIGRALRALGARKIAMVTPYSEEVIARAKHYYHGKFGIDVVACESLGASNAYAIGKMDAGAAQAAFARIDSPAVEALMVPGGNFPTMDRIAAWEGKFGKPVVTTQSGNALGDPAHDAHCHAARWQGPIARSDAGRLACGERRLSATLGAKVVANNGRRHGCRKPAAASAGRC